MKIGLLVRAYPIASETFVHDQLTELRALGHEVEVLSALRPEDPAEGVTYLLPGGLRSAGFALAALKGLGVVLARPASWKSWGPLLRRQGLRALLPLALAGRLAGRGQDRDILLCHFGGVGLWGDALRATFWPDLPQATIFHGIDLSAVVRRHGVHLYRHIFGPRHLSVPIASTWLPVLAILGDPRAHYLRLGIDPERFAFRQRSQPAADQPIRVITVGRLVPKKGQELVLQAMAERPKPLRWHYDLVGDGPQMAGLKALAGKLGLEDNVTFHGRQTHDEVARLLAAADVFALPSQTSAEGDMEGVPVALMEAMASGLPVITSHHSGIVDLVADGETGMMVREGDVAGIAAAMARLEAEPELWPRITAAARAKVEGDYHLARNTALLADTLERFCRASAG